MIFALSFHEYAHAWMAYKCGDNTAARMGRLSMNPIAHLDPMGSLMILFVGFGWAKPVPVDSRLLVNPRTDMMKVAAAGPIANLKIADDKVVKEVKMRDDLHINATSIITFFTKSIMTELRLYGGQDILYGKLKQFLVSKLFGETVNLEDTNVARNLSETNVRFVIRETFKKYINALTVVNTGTTEVQNYIKVSNQKTFSIPRAKEFLPAKKSIFNKIQRNFIFYRKRNYFFIIYRAFRLRYNSASIFIK